MLCTCPNCGTLTRLNHLCPECQTPTGRGSRTAAALLMGLALAGCDSGEKQDTQMRALYGVADTAHLDADGDGYEAVETGGSDCDDNNKDIHPDATETPGDSIDSNCDGSDDT